jgi:hypothetical protein
MAQRELDGKVTGLWGGLYSLAILLFWIFLGVKGLLPENPVRKRRKGYRQSGKS